MTAEATQRLIGAKKLDVPNVFASYRICDYPRAGLRCHPWQMTETQAVLLNAFDLLASKGTSRFTDDIRQCQGKLHEYIEFNGPIMLDSGAFNFLKHQEIGITPAEVLGIGLELQADVAVVLDHPFPPKADAEKISARWDSTRRNTQVMIDMLETAGDKVPANFQLMPVIHGHDIQILEQSLNDVARILGRMPESVGIGSLAGLAQNGSKRTAIDVIMSVRKLLPEAYIHCFSMGSALLMLFAFYCGADTVDSQSWIMSAAFKQVQLPGFYLTRFSPREAQKDPVKYERTRRAFAQHLLRLVREEGFTVRDWDQDQEWPIGDEDDALAYVSYLEDKDGVNHTHRRACHNLYTFNFEASQAREARNTSTLEAFIQSRMRSTMYRKAFEYAIDRKTQVFG